MEQLNPKDLDAGLQEIGLGDGSTEAPVSRAKQMYQPSTDPLPMSGEFEKVDHNAIIIPENRIREKFDKKSLESQGNPARVRGLIHPLKLGSWPWSLANSVSYAAVS